MSQQKDKLIIQSLVVNHTIYDCTVCGLIACFVFRDNAKAIHKHTTVKFGQETSLFWRYFAIQTHSDAECENQKAVSIPLGWASSLAVKIMQGSVTKRWGGWGEHIQYI